MSMYSMQGKKLELSRMDYLYRDL